MHHEWLHPILVVLSIAALWYAITNFGTIKRVIVGRPMRTKELEQAHTKLVWWIALPILAADLYSSVAYGPEAGITELSALGPGVKWFIIPITAAAVCLLAVLITSYIMGVIAYPSGGGAYAIAKDNFRKPWMSLVAASALLTDYILTVAVSVSAGIEAMVSAYPRLLPYQTTLSIVCIFVILLVNLRGVSESATVFAWPTFIFMGLMLILIITGFVDELHHGFVQNSTPPFGTIPHGLTVLLSLKAFSSACSSLTGLETISNSVPIFRDRSNGAIKAYIVLGVLTGVTLLGFAYHIYVKGVSVDPHNTMLSQLAGVYFGHGVIYQLLIWSTFVVLILAANSTFTGFPQLAALVASDDYFPRTLRIRGDRLGYSNGMIVLAALSALLIEAFHAQTNALIPLYAIGVFVAFTVAQIGLTRRWIRVKGPKWRIKVTINTIGAFVTAVVAIIFAITKFLDGAWIVLIVLPALVIAEIAIRRHYDQIAEELRIDLKNMRPGKHHVVSLILVSGIHRVVLNTVQFAKSLNSDVIAVYVGFDEESIERMERKWEEWGAPCRLVTLKSEYRSVLGPLSRFVQRIQTWEGGKPDHINIYIGQFIPKRWWHYILHNQTAFLLRTWLLKNKDVVITTVPYHLHH
ncbi:APC family permease [Alicyclobacillus kakegawensis]|uniref:APC family permease n=1 Tax=Alicyclobacillus kakegawensis TaxID=392012 RepID=UPI00082C6C23|nr:APC family permease [Alicyclobacillus kakegawensis]